MTHHLLTTLFTLIILAWMVQAILAAIQVFKFSLAFGHARRPRLDAYQPAAVIIVPFKGIDTDLAANVRSLCTQDYPRYRLLLVVDSIDDPAYALLLKEIAQFENMRAEVLVAGAAAANEGQKIHNQLHALQHVTEDDEVLVFADSDAAPGPNWLRDMVGPLAQEKTGMTTGYRWLIPSGSRSLASQLASVINGAVACGYRRGDWSQAWGGAMALRAETARAGDLAGHLRGALTDDYQFTRMCRTLNKRVTFVPRALAPTPVDFDWRGFFNFAYRQYLITRIYAPRLYAAALGITSLYLVGTLTAWAVLIVALRQRPIDWAGASAGLAIVTVFIAHQVRTTFRRRVIERAFGRAMLGELRTALNIERFATPLVMLVHWLIIVRAGLSRTMTWRGLRYRLHAPQHVERV